MRSGLAGVLVERYRVRQDIADLDEAVNQLQSVLSSVPEASSERPAFLSELAQALALRSENAAAGATDRQDATSTYRICCDAGSRTSPAVTLAAGRSWGDWALHRQTFYEAAEAYRYASAASHDLFRAQQLRSHQENWLRPLQGMPENRAYACARARHSEEAAAAMEGDRALLLSAALQLHNAQLDELRATSAGELADRYEACVQRLAILQRLELSSRFDPTIGISNEPDDILPGNGRFAGDGNRANCGHGDCSRRTSSAASAYRLARAASGRLDSAADTRAKSSASKIARARSRRATAARMSLFCAVA